MSISVLILTKNEELNLPACLESVRWSDDIHVYDSFSTDETLAVAERFGAKVTQHSYAENNLAFGGDESSHRNWGLRNIAFKNSWVLVIDADERVTPSLFHSIKNAILTNHHNVAFRLQRRDFFLATWIKHVQTSAYYIRLFMPDKLHYERLINPILVVDGPVGELSGFLDHYPFSKGVSDWINRHNSYSTFEAQQIIQNRKDRSDFSIKKAFFEKDFNERRFHQKELFYRLPFRPLIKFLILYVGKRGFLDGRAGFTYAILQSIYEYFIVLKTRELESQQPK